MKSSDIHVQLTESYLQLLKNLSPNNKLDLIAKLTHSIKADIKKKNNAFAKAFGGWQGGEDIEKFVTSIRMSRQFNRQIEEF